MAKEISVENVCKFITDHGGKVKNTILVSNFKKVLNDPATKDEARQKFKECVNIVAVVKTENGEKYVQLKKKYRSLSMQSGSPVADASFNISNVSQDSSSGHDTSFNPATDLPYADGRKHEKSPSSATHKSPEKSKHSRSPSQEKLNQSSSRHHSSHKEEEAPEHRSPSKSHSNHHRRSESNHGKDQVQNKEVTPPVQDTKKEQQDRREKEKSLKEVSTHKSPSKSHGDHHRKLEAQVQREKENSSKSKTEESSTDGKPASTPSSKSAPDANFAIPASVPIRKKKDKKENVPPSPKPEHIPQVASVDRLKSNFLNSSDQRPPRSRPTSVAQGSYSGSVERARQNFLNKQKANDDSASLALSERSLDSKGDEQDDEYDRNLPSLTLDINEKEWIIRSAQGNLVEMRKLLNNDSTLADKRDFIMSALHWAAKKGNPDMVNMLIDQKVNINCRSNGGYTPLHIAAMHGHEDIITLLLDAGCDSNVRDYSGHQPIHYLKSVSLPLQRILFGNDGTHMQAPTKEFVAGLRPKGEGVRKSQNRLSSAISGGFSSVGQLVAKSLEDHNKSSNPDQNFTRNGSLKGKTGKSRKSKKVKDERPRISVVSVNDSDSGFTDYTNSSKGGMAFTSPSPTLRRSDPSTPPQRRSATKSTTDA